MALSLEEIGALSLQRIKKKLDVFVSTNLPGYTVIDNLDLAFLFFLKGHFTKSLLYQGIKTTLNTGGVGGAGTDPLT